MLTFYSLYFDGACGPKNPGGTASFGFELYKPGVKEPIVSGSEIVGSGPEMSNNVGEYAGLVAGLDAFANLQLSRAELEHTTLQVRGDSQLVINQMSGKWKAKGGLYWKYYERAKNRCWVMRQLGVKITFDWIPREMNQKCDDLSKSVVRLAEQS